MRAVTTIVAYFTLPKGRRQEAKLVQRKDQSGTRSLEQHKDEDKQQTCMAKMDWIGGGTLFFCLNLVLVALIASPQAPNGWRTSYVYMCLILVPA